MRKCPDVRSAVASTAVSSMGAMGLLFRLFVCIAVLERHLVLLLLAALVICVVYMYSGVLGMHLVQEGSGPCKIPICMDLWDMQVVYRTCIHRPATKLRCRHTRSSYTKILCSIRLCTKETDVVDTFIAFPK